MGYSLLIVAGTSMILFGISAPVSLVLTGVSLTLLGVSFMTEPLKDYNILGGEEQDNLMDQIRSSLKNWQQQEGLSKLKFADINIFYDDHLALSP